jgi:hypothetical protein
MWRSNRWLCSVKTWKNCRWSPFVRFLKVECKLDSYADVVFSRHACSFLYFWNELFHENSFLSIPSQGRSHNVHL